MAILPTVIYRFNAILIKMPAGFFIEIDKLILQCMWKFRRPRTTKIMMSKNKVGGLTITNFKTYHKATITKTVWCWHKARHTHQWNRSASP